MHQRARHILDIFKKRSKFWPVLGLVGVRQTGKSTFLRDVWVNTIKGTYATFDDQEIRLRAAKSCEHFLLSNSNDLTSPLIIDEAHKVPDIFDSIKALIDRKRRIGVFTLSGSVEFGDRAGVREALTGRMGMLRLYPFTLREANNRDFHSPWAKLFQKTRSERKAVRKVREKDRTASLSTEIEILLERGGMPIFCPIRDVEERRIAVQAWADAICYRDLHQLKGAKYDSDIASASLRYVAQHPFCSALEIAHELGEDTRVVKKNLKGLEALFVIYELSPRAGGLKQSAYLLFDAGVARALGASRKQVLPIFFINEILAQLENSGLGKPGLYHYKSKNLSRIDLILEMKNNLIGINFQDKVSPSRKSMDSLRALGKISESLFAMILCPVQESYEERDGVHVMSWKDFV